MDTIVAVATPPGAGGIGIVRMSGPEAVTVAERLFRRPGGAPLSAAAPLHLVLGAAVDPRSGEPIDEVLAVRMPAGRSYTGEPVVELQAHAGKAVLDAIVAGALACGARIAEPGEFTRRAFLGGRLDLSQAEAVADLIAAESEEARRQALRQLQGETGSAVRSLRERLLDLVGAAEALLDFAEEEQLPDRFDHAAIEAIAAEIRELVAWGKAGNSVRDGLKVVVTGRTNAGKSSLFNKILDSPRSIVTPAPGTTRDFIEERATVCGVPVVLVDTAGIRDPGDAAEAEGIRRSMSLLYSADLVLHLIDRSAPLHDADREMLLRLRERPSLVVATKTDLPQELDTDALLEQVPGPGLFPLSLVDGSGYDPLLRALAERCRGLRAERRGGNASPNLRHQAILARTLSCLESAVAFAGTGPLDLLATELRSALDSLGEITGETATEEVLERIFSRFCIGK
jgi:tRNA modification GTPase